MTPDLVKAAMSSGFLSTDRRFVAAADRNEWMDGSTVSSTRQPQPSYMLQTLRLASMAGTLIVQPRT